MAHRPRQSDHNETDEDALYQLPLADFTSARNALASRLKKDGNHAEAARIKTLAKPSISAWVVNQLYWKRGEEFAHLLEAGNRLRGANIAEIRAPLQMRRDAVTRLLSAAEKMMEEAGHSPTSEIMRRVESTLEALSALPDHGPHGRLTEDLTPPGFEQLAALFPVQPPAKPVRAKPADDKESAKTRALREAQEALDAARERSTAANALFKEAEARVDLADTRRNEAKKRFDEADAAAASARERAQDMKAAAQTALDSLKAAERAVEKLSSDMGKRRG
jgi:methyl-accepting chemotaxis protein